MSSPAASNITSVLKETRSFPPPADFAAKAHIKGEAEYEKLYHAASTIPRAFGPSRPMRLHWFQPWDKTLIWNEPFVQWFVGG